MKVGKIIIIIIPLQRKERFGGIIQHIQSSTVFQKKRDVNNIWIHSLLAAFALHASNWKNLMDEKPLWS